MLLQLMYGGEAPLSSTGVLSLKVDAKVRGLGPLFRVMLSLKNMGDEPVENLAFTISYNRDLYKLSFSAGTVSPCRLFARLDIRSVALPQIPIILPGIPYEREVTVYCIDPAGRRSSSLN